MWFDGACFCSHAVLKPWSWVTNTQLSLDEEPHHDEDPHPKTKDDTVQLHNPPFSRPVFGQDAPAALPSLYPLKYFPTTGKPIFNLRYIMDQAHNYVSKLKPPKPASMAPATQQSNYLYADPHRAATMATTGQEAHRGAAARAESILPREGHGAGTAAVLRDVEAKLDALQRRLDAMQPGAAGQASDLQPPPSPAAA